MRPASRQGCYQIRCKALARAGAGKLVVTLVATHKIQFHLGRAWWRAGPAMGPWAVRSRLLSAPMVGQHEMVGARCKTCLHLHSAALRTWRARASLSGVGPQLSLAVMKTSSNLRAPLGSV